jgi:IclR family pca regulon transcriptional regulator
MGKVLLAHLDPERQHAVLDEVQFAQRGPNTLTAKDDLLLELVRVRESGVAVNNEELAYGLRSIAAPIRGRSSEVVAAINLAVHRSMVSLDALVAHLSRPLLRTAAEISSRVGYREAFTDG